MFLPYCYNELEYEIIVLDTYSPVQSEGRDGRRVRWGEEGRDGDGAEPAT